VIDQAQKLRELVESRNLQKTSSPPTGNVNNKSCRSIAITSGKGGVGKTNISLFLALVLASTRKRVLLLDADLGLANVHILLGIAPKHDISHFIKAECRLKDIICKGPGGIDILPGASGLENLANLDSGRLELLQHEFAAIEQDYDYILIDTGAGIGAAVTQFASRADMAVLVMTPEPTSLADAYAMVKVLYERGCTHIGTVVNMANSDIDGSETFDRLNAIVVKFLKKPLELLGTLPFDRDLPKCVRRQKLLVVEKAESGFTVRIQAIARKISGSVPVRKQSFFSRLWERKLFG